MGTVDIVSYMTQALYLTLWLSLPPIAVAAIVGTLFSLFQALTQIQDQTLPQVVKLVAVLLTIVFLGPILAGQVAELGGQVLDNFPMWTR